MIKVLEITGGRKLLFGFFNYLEGWTGGEPKIINLTVRQLAYKYTSDINKSTTII